MFPLQIEQYQSVKFIYSAKATIFMRNIRWSLLWKIKACNLFTTSESPNIRILQIFCLYLLKGDKKTFFIGRKYFLDQWKMFSCPPSINKNKDLENWNSNIWRLWCREQVNKSKPNFILRILSFYIYLAYQNNQNYSTYFIFLYLAYQNLNLHNRRCVR